MVVTDLDGTLLQKDRHASERNIAVLRHLGQERILRAIATGRNLFSARKVIPPEFPVDYLLFSSGAGIMEWSNQKLVRALSMSRAERKAAFDVLVDEGLDFMIHDPIPRNHHLVAFGTGRHNPDFLARLEIYRDSATFGDRSAPPDGEASQFVAIEPRGDAVDVYDRVRSRLPSHSVIRSTSPLGSGALWIEIFPAAVSKSQAAAWLSERCGVARETTLAVGNDHNDADLLGWAHAAFLVRGSPPELASRFPLAISDDDSDFAEAVSAWERAEGRRRDREKDYDLVAEQARSLWDPELPLSSNLANISALLKRFLDHTNWVGFYLWDVSRRELILGPFQGLPACARIGAGQGVCGAAVSTRRTQRVGDVHQFPGHIACDTASQSELVVPLLRGQTVLGVLDIDSPVKDRFDAIDQEKLERIAQTLVGLWPAA